jgi:hypothetical protein
MADRQSAILGSNSFLDIIFYYILIVHYSLYCPVWYSKVHGNPILIGGSNGGNLGVAEIRQSGK